MDKTGCRNPRAAMAGGKKPGSDDDVVCATTSEHSPLDSRCLYESFLWVRRTACLIPIDSPSGAHFSP